VVLLNSLWDFLYVRVSNVTLLQINYQQVTAFLPANEAWERLQPDDYHFWINADNLPALFQHHVVLGKQSQLFKISITLNFVNLSCVLSSTVIILVMSSSSLPPPHHHHLAVQGHRQKNFQDVCVGGWGQRKKDRKIPCMKMQGGYGPPAPTPMATTI